MGSMLLMTWTSGPIPCWLIPPSSYHLPPSHPTSSNPADSSHPCYFMNHSDAHWLAVPFFWNSFSWNALIPFLYLMRSVCSSIQYQLKSHGLLEPPLYANYLFTCWSSPWTVSSAGSHRSCFPLYPQCSARSLEITGLPNKFKDYSKRMSYRTHFARAHCRFKRVCLASRADWHSKAGDADEDDLF